MYAFLVYLVIPDPSFLVFDKHKNVKICGVFGNSTVGKELAQILKLNKIPKLNN